MARKKDARGELLVCRNPKATQQYEIEERIEAGMVLTGSEVKSLRARKADLEGAYASLDRGEMVLHKMHIAPYEQAGAFGHEPKRSRKLLMHRKEIERWEGRLTRAGYTVVPLAVYFKEGYAKVELGLAKGKKRGDKREELKREVDMKEARAAVSRAKR
ncbi:MAG: SsrA-binding protein SmpB [Sandaracinaceae bacterium]|nr:SsrA-binding protein SmpB [Sandaracinaceae bacterium]